jgi:hypothetical protein
MYLRSGSYGGVATARRPIQVHLGLVKLLQERDKLCHAGVNVIVEVEGTNDHDELWSNKFRKSLVFS